MIRARSRVVVCLLVSVVVGFGVVRGVRAQSADADVIARWTRALAALDARAATVDPGDISARAGVLTAARAIEDEVSRWIAARGQTSPAAAPAGSNPDIVLAHVRALIDQARTLTSASEQGVFYLGRVDVAVAATAAQAGVSSIGAADMQARDADTVGEAIEAAPGVTLHRVGPRNEAMVYIRGFDLRQVPLFIDGVPVYVPYDGYVDLDRFVTTDLSEIRVTKGMTSVLIGPNALGGAINLVTRRPTEPLGGLVHVSYGSGNERGVDADLGVLHRGWYAYGTASWIAADDFPLSGAFAPNALEDGGARDNASHRDAKVNVKLAMTPHSGSEYTLSYITQRGQKDVPAYAGDDSLVRPRFWRWPDWNKDSVYFVSNTILPRGQYVRGRVYYDRFYNELDAFDDNGYATMTRPSSFRSIYDDYTTGASAEYGVPLAGRQTLRAAGHWKEDIHREHNIGDPIQHFDNRTLSVGVEDTITLSASATLVAGIGADRQITRRAENLVDDAIASFPLGRTGGVNPQIALFLATPRGGQFRVTASRKTRLPAIKDRYSYRMGSAIPNPDLAAEQATTIETGYDTPVGRRSNVSLTAFYTAVNDLVQAFYLEPNLFQLQNVGDVRNAGLEAEWRLRPVRAFQGSIGYSYLHRRSVGEPVVPLLNTPAHKAFGSVTFTGLPHVRLMASVNRESSRDAQDDGGLLLDLDGYTTVDAKATVDVARGVEVSIFGSNLLDENYELYAGFPEEGRAVRVEARWRF